MPVNTGLGIIGICGSGGFSVAATAIDHSIKALIPVSVYDMGRVRVRDFWTSKVIQAPGNGSSGSLALAEYVSDAPDIQFGARENLPKNASGIAKKFYN